MQSGVPSQFTLAAGPPPVHAASRSTSVSPCRLTRLPVRPGPFVRSDGVHVPPEAVQAWGVVTGERTAEVTICVDAGTLTGDRGVNHGRILINGPGVDPASLDLVLDADPPRWKMVLLGLGLCRAGSI